MDGERLRANAPPKRSLGQVFLNSGATVSRIVAALGLKKGDSVLEIGPGRGALTRLLQAHEGPLTLVEKDDDLAARLKERFADSPMVRILAMDAISLDLAPLLQADERVKVVANLPYNAGTPILMNLLRQRDHVERLVLMFQREVARRLTATPGERTYGALSIHVQAQATVEALFDVSPEKFVPQPKVWSSVVRITPLPLDVERTRIVDAPAFEAFLRALHAQPRKTVANSLADGLGGNRREVEAGLVRAKIDVRARPCCISPDQAIRLWQVMMGLLGRESVLGGFL